MHNIRKIRENPTEFDMALKRRFEEPCANEILDLDFKRRTKILESENAQAEKNAAASEIKQAKFDGAENRFNELRDLVIQKKEEITKLDLAAKEADETLNKFLLQIPNLRHLRRTKSNSI